MTETAVVADRATMIASYCERLWGDLNGWVFAGHGRDPYEATPGKVKHRRFDEQPFAYPRQRDELVDHVLTESDRCDVWLTPGLSENPIRKLDRRKSRSSRYLWFDLDNPGAASMQRASQLITAGSFAIASGRGPGHRHGYIKLDELTAPHTVADFNRRLVSWVHGDPSPSALCGYLRPEGSLNWKPTVLSPGSEPVLVAASTVTEGNGWAISDLDDLLPLADEPDGEDGHLGPAEPLPNPLPPLVAAILTDHADENIDRSERLFALVVACRDAGMTAGQTISAGRLHRPSVAKYGRRVDEHVGRCLAKLPTKDQVSVKNLVADDNLAGLIDLNRRRLHNGSTILDAPLLAESVWGQNHRCLWAKGEPFLIVGPDGVGKTTLAQRLALLRAGIRTGDMLGLAVQPDAHRVLYLACDRPSHAIRSFRRMVDDDDSELLAERLEIWKGPLPFDLGKNPEGLAALAKAVGAGTIFLDSLKDVAADLSKEEVGARLNTAFQTCVADGIEIAGLHHQRKAQAGAGKPRHIADVYGSRWITAGAGSIIMLWGEPGDSVVDLDHLKQPSEQFGPVQIVHDHIAGITTLVDQIDAYTLVMAATVGGTTAGEAAIRLYGNPNPDRNSVEKARRQLERLANDGRIHKRDGSKGGATGGEPARYYPLTQRQGGP